MLPCEERFPPTHWRQPYAPPVQPPHQRLPVESSKFVPLENVWRPPAMKNTQGLFLLVPTPFRFLPGWIVTDQFPGSENHQRRRLRVSRYAFSSTAQSAGLEQVG